jgi:phosphoribosylformylglycinamidine (FGAM) synthase-like enzyme
LGATAKLEENGPAEAALFGERGARAVVSVKPPQLARVLDTARQYQVAAYEIGKVIRGDAFRIQYKESAVIDSSIPALRDAWANSVERAVKNA